MVRTRAQANKLHKIKRSRRSRKPDDDVSLEEASSSGDRKMSISNPSTNLSLEGVDSSGGRKGVDKSYIKKTSKSITFRASQSHFLNSSSEEVRLLEGRSLLNNLANFSDGRLSDNLQLGHINRTQVLNDDSSGFKDSNIKMDIMQIQQLSSLQASADRLDIPPNTLECSVILTNIKMPKGFHKYLDETVFASIAKTSSEQDTLEERNHSTSESQPASSPSPSKPGDKRRGKERHENQQLFQEVLGNDSKQHASTDSLPYQEADASQNSTLSTPTATQPFGKKRNRSLVETDYEKVLTHLSTTFSPRKYSSKIGGNLSQQSISMTPQAVQQFGKRQKRIENEDIFGDVLSQSSPRLSLKKSASRIGEVSQQSIPKSPQGVQPFGKRGKRLQNEDNFEAILSQSSPRLSPRKLDSKTGEVSQSSISESPQAIKPFGKRQKRLQNEDNFEDTLSQLSPRTSPRKLNSKTSEISESSISKSPQAVKPFSKRKKVLRNEENFEDTVSQLSPRTSPRKLNSKTSEISESSISKSPQAVKPFGKRQKSLQNEDNFEAMLDQLSPGLFPKKINSKIGEVSQSSISKSLETVKLFGKKQKSFQNEDNFEDTLSQLSPRTSPRKLNSKTSEISESSISKSPQAVKPFGKRKKGLKNEVNFEDTVSQLSLRTSPKKLNSKTSEISESSISKSPQAVKPFGKRQKSLQNEDNFEAMLDQSYPGVSPKKIISKTSEGSQSSISKSLQTVKPFGKRQKSLQNEDNFEDTVSQLSPRRFSRKLGSTAEVSGSSISKSPQAVQQRQNSLQEDDFEDMLAQSSPKLSPKKISSKTGEVSQSSISKSPQAIQPFSKGRKRLQKEGNFEDILAQSSPGLSPEKINYKTGEVSQSRISNSPQAVKPLSKRQKSLQNEDNFEDTVSQVSSSTSPRKLNSNTSELSQSNISKSLQTVQSFGKSQKRLQNEDSIEDTLHQSVKLSSSKSTIRTEEVSQQSISNTPQTVQPFGKRKKTIQNEINFEDILSQSSSRLSPRKSNSMIGEVSYNSISEPPATAHLFSKTQKMIQNRDNFADSLGQSFRSNFRTEEVSQSSISKSPQTLQPTDERQKRIQSEINFEDVLSGSSILSPRKSSSKTGGLLLNNISESPPAEQSFSHTQKKMQNEDTIHDDLRISAPRLSTKKHSSRIKVLQDIVSESSVTKLYGKTQDKIQNEDNSEDNLSQPSTVREVSQSSIFKSLPPLQQVGKRQKEVQNENNFEEVLNQSLSTVSTGKSSSRFKENFESSPIIKPFVNRERRAHVFEDILDIPTSKQTASKSTPECIENRSDISVVVASEAPNDVLQPEVHGNLFDSDYQESEVSLKINKKQNNCSKNHVDTEINSSKKMETALTFLKSLEGCVSSKNISNTNTTGTTAPPVLILEESLKESIDSEKQSETHYLENLRETSYNSKKLDKISEEHYKDHVIHTSEKQENAPQKAREVLPSQYGVDKALQGALQSSQVVYLPQSHNDSKTVHISSELQSSHLQQVSLEGSTAGHFCDENESDIGSNMLEVQASHQLDGSNNNARETEKTLDASSAYPAEMPREASKRIFEELPTRQQQKHKDSNVLSPQESSIESITSEQHLDTLSAKQKLAICLRESIMKNQSHLSSSETVTYLTKDNSKQNPKNISNQLLLADTHFIPSHELNSPVAKMNHLSIQKDTTAKHRVPPKHSSTFKETTYAATREHALETGSTKSHELESQKFNAVHTEVQMTDPVELMRKDGLEQSEKHPDPLSVPHYVMQNSSWRSFGSARMDTSASSSKSTTDESLYLRLKTKRKRFRKLSQLKRFDGETSDSSNMSKNMGAERPRFVRKRKQSHNTNNDLVLTKNVTNTVPRVGASVPLSGPENEVQNITGLVVADSNMAEYLNTVDVIHTRIEDEHRKEKEYQQSSTKKLNYTGLDSHTWKPASKAKTDSRLFKSWLERSYGQKKQKKLENHDKQLKIPFYHRPCTRVNEPHNLHLVLKGIAEGNVHQNKRLEDKSTLHFTAEAKEQKAVKKIRKANSALMVNGKVYRAPRLARPKQWVNKRLYDHIMPSITAKYGEANSRIKAEEYVKYLCDQVSTVIRRKNYNNYRSNLEKIKKSLYNLGLIKCYNDYFIFIEKYLPYEFRYKAVPCLRAFGKHTGPPWSKDINIFADLGY